ncbi:TlpA family protein disulfide reductase [Nocardioides sp. cx-169]|uniref:TlpA family protein disulfide reductase n=1 Tax=Nocardioides sp. cx-169 TaxID=2899080 RepID=UPI001E334FB7|nr:TlpA disulfide reductase family protein [Nocardioides sp. cx-169]MCD4533459.1 TlpA family protein disulfide reductase [Nocardioides sp. cx-169]
MSSLRRIAAPLLVTLLTAGLTAGCSGLQGTGDGDYVPGAKGNNVAEVAVEERESPIELSGTTLDGEELALDDLRGEVVVVNVWWSQCAPCRSEMPMLVEASEELDATFVGINIRNSSEAEARTFETKYGVTYPSIHDPGSETLLAFGTRYFPRSMPSTVVLDREGRVASLVSGPIPSRTTLEALVEGAAAADG